MVGQDDVLVREYRQGDDVRRIHWRSTARWGDLMVRREEQAWDPSASIMLDSRVGAHAGRGMHNSMEWAISAAASIGIHFLDDGFSIEIYEAEGPLHISGSMGQHSSASRAGDQPVDRSAGRGRRPSLHYAVETATIDRPGQLVVAILGRMTAEDANALLRLRRNRAQGLAIMLDVDTFADQPAAPISSGRSRSSPPDPARQPVAGDRGSARNGCRGRLVGARTTGSGGLMRPSDRSGIAVSSRSRWRV